MTTKGRTFLKIGVLWMISGILLLAFWVTSTDAISYYNSSQGTKPNFILSWVTHPPRYWPYAYDSLGAIWYYDNSQTGTIYMKSTVFFRVYSWATSWAFYCSYYNAWNCSTQNDWVRLEYSWATQDVDLYIRAHGSDIRHEYFDFTNRTSSWQYPNDFVVAFNFNWKWYDWIFDELSLYSYDYFVWNNENAQARYWSIFYTWYSEDGIWVSDTNSLNPHYYFDSWRYMFSTSGYPDYPVSNSYYLNWQYWIFLFSNASSSGHVTTPAWYFYGSSWYTNVETSTGTTGTWTDYFSDCSSFLDVGCYISWFWDWVTWTISGWFVSLFPDVSWSAAYTNGCSSWSWWTWSNLSWSWIWYIEKLQTFMLVVIPLSPPEWTEYCLLWWFTWTIEYQKYVPSDMKNQVEWYGSIFDVIFLLLMGYIMIATIMRHGWLHMNTGDNPWEVPEIFHRQETFTYDVKKSKKNPIKTNVETPFNKKETFKYK